MELHKVNILNKGMSQDVSISKDSQEFAFENKNIRIQAMDDGTLLSITNVKGPLEHKEVTLYGKIVAKCIAGKYLVVFTSEGDWNKSHSTDRIYRIDLRGLNNNGEVICKCLFKGVLNLEPDRTFDTLYHSEGEKVQKVYWTESWYSDKEMEEHRKAHPKHTFKNNSPRVINIITPKERNTGTEDRYIKASTFEFYPEIGKLPKFNILKIHDASSQMPSGVIQYFASYYNYNGAETLIANSSASYTLDYEMRGATAEEVGTCAFEIKVSNLNTEFDYCRIYSAIRTSIDGPLIVKIVGDIKIDKRVPSKTYQLLDTGINQEQLEAGQLYFIGGTPFFAKSLTSKDNTVFFGNIKTDPITLPKELKDAIKATITHVQDIKKKYKGDPETKTPELIETIVQDEHFWSKLIKFTRCDKSPKYTTRDTKGFPLTPNQFSEFYPYRLQTSNSSVSYKTFKGGEIYRFGIQFQSKKGQWSPVVWLGDKECTFHNDIREQEDMVLLNNASFTFPKEILSLCKSLGFANYRIVMADPEIQNGRKIQAQGVVCPTMFAPGQRALKSSYAIPSWVMRPRKGPLAYHHFEPPFAASTAYSEIEAYDPGNWYSAPYFLELEETADYPEYLVSVFCINCGHIICTKNVKVKSSCSGNSFYDDNGNALIEYKETIWEPHDDEESGGNKDKKYWNTTSWGKVIDHWTEAYKKSNIDTRYILNESTLSKMGSNDFWDDFIKVLFILLAAVVFILSMVISYGGATGLGILLADIICGIGVLAAGAVAGVIHHEQYEAMGLTYAQFQEIVKQYEGLPDWQKDLFGKGYICIGSGTKALSFFSDTQTTFAAQSDDGVVNKFSTMPLYFKPDGLEDMIKAHNDTVVYVQCLPVNVLSYYSQEIRGEMNNFYVDESIVTMHSPEIDFNPSLINNKNLKFRVIGAIPTYNSYSDFEIQTETAGFLKEAGPEFYPAIEHRNAESYNPLVSDYLYQDSSWKGNEIAKNYDGNQEEGILSGAAGLYKLHLWDSSGSIIGATKETLYGEEPIDQVPCILKSKTFFNHTFCKGVKYLDTPVDYQPSRVKVATGDGTALSIESRELVLYTPNYDTLITKDQVNTYIRNQSDITNTTPLKGKKKPASVRLKFNTTQHAVFSLNKGNLNFREILPEYRNSNNKYIGVQYCGKAEVGKGWTNIKNEKRPIKCCWTTHILPYHSDKFFLPIQGLYTGTKPEMPSQFQIGTDSFKDLLMNQLYRKTNLLTVQNYARANKAIIGFDYIVKLPPSGHERAFNHLFDTYKIRYKLRIKDVILKKWTNGNGYNLEDIVYEEIDNGKAVDSLAEEVYAINLKFNNGKYYTFTKNSGLVRYNGFPIHYNQKIINEPEPVGPYLFLGELYYDTKHKDLYGGFSEDNIKNLIWYPISEVTPIGEDISTMEGDTYYQRYDCLKTYPTTESDTNKVVDITSFMVESHINLDARTDVNRGKFNIMSRPTNFNLFNPVYSCKNNIFQYTVDYNDLEDTEHPTQFTWSLVKNTLAEVDSWTNVSLAAISSCDYPITKLLVYNNTVLGLTEGSLEQINFNAKGLVPSADNSFIEIASSSKVDGTVQLQYPYGSFNSSVLITEKGLYFIDDNEKSIIRMNSSEGATKIGIGKLDHWFKNNIKRGTHTQANKQPFHLEYDPIHKDIYILNEDNCLIYNESLEAFTSFMDSSECNTLFTLGGDLYALANGYTGVFEMFAGEYNRTFGNKVTDYSIHYRVNPAPYSDKVFTNVEFLADCFNPTLQAGEKPFDTIRAWNEYQDTGICPLIFDRHTPSSLKQKFRIWRADIPRDINSKYGRDRIRNPWINLKMTKHNTENNTSKLELHSMNVQYML